MRPLLLFLSAVYASERGVRGVEATFRKRRIFDRRNRGAYSFFSSSSPCPRVCCHPLRENIFHDHNLEHPFQRSKQDLLRDRQHQWSQQWSIHLMLLWCHPRSTVLYLHRTNFMSLHNNFLCEKDVCSTSTHIDLKCSNALLNISLTLAYSLI